MLFETGQIVNHSAFGRGEIIFIEERADYLGNETTYLDVHFDQDDKYKVRTFTADSLKKFLF